MESSFVFVLTLAISVLQSVLKWCRKEHNKKQVKRESQRSQGQRWIWSRDAAKGLLMCYFLLHPKARWRPDMIVNFFWAREVSEWKIDETWSSQEWKCDELMDDRTGRPVVCPQGGAHASQTRFSRPPGFHKLLSVTVTTFAVFPSWMYLLSGDDNCMLSVPSSTCDLHISCCQGGDICQAVAADASTHCDTLSVQSCCLANVLPAQRFPSSRPDTGSFRSCLFLPPGFLDTREAGICARSSALSSFFFTHSVLLVVALARWPQAACE